MINRRFLQHVTSGVLLLTLGALWALFGADQRPAVDVPPGEVLTTLVAAGVPEDPVVVFAEDFENRPGSTPIVRLDGYTGVDGTTYTAAPAWLTGCNGWIAQWDQPVAGTDQVSDCGQQRFWNQTQQLAQALGINGGQSTFEARSNFAVTALTFNSPAANLTEFQTTTNVPLAGSGRFLTTTVDVAATACNVRAPILQFQLVDDTGAAANVGGRINACATTNRLTVEARGAQGPILVNVDTYTSNGALLWNSPTIGLRMINIEGGGTGNDHAFDNVEIVDATPSLDKSFSPTTQAVGAISRLTLTVTNTTERGAKNGWSFTDSLPAGLQVATPNAISTTCPGASITAPAGGTSVAATGNLSTGMTSCQIAVDVTASLAGDYTNGPDNVTATGLNPPEQSTVTFTDTDYADGPASTGSATTSHTLTPGLSLGALRDSEPSAAGSAAATGDDLAGVDDEDAVTGTPRWRVDQPLTLPVPVVNTSGGPATLTGWIDTDGNGAFDAGEAAAAAAVPVGATEASLAWPAAPAAVIGPSFLRLRLHAGSPVSPSAVGPAIGGEVEDHPIQLDLPAIEVTKEAGAVQDRDGNGVDAGDVITYTIMVSNTGTVALSPFSVVDPLLGGTLACGSTTLAAGATRTCPSVDYTLTQDDVETGERLNEVVATGTPPTGPEVSDSAEVSTPVEATSAISLTKEAGPIVDVDGNLTDAGDTVTYSFEVTNTGGRVLSGIEVADPITGPVTCAATTLAPAASTTCTVTLSLSQGDIDAGEVINTATVSGQDGTGEVVTDEASATVTIPTRPGLTLDKQVVAVADTNGNGRRDAGDTISYVFLVTNSGPTTLTGVEVDDPLAAPVACPGGNLAPRATTTCTASHVVTQAEADAGAVRNTATASAQTLDGSPIDAAPDSTTTLVPRTGRLVLDKQAGTPVDVDGDDLIAAGDTIDYTFTLTNRTTVTLSALEVDDPLVGAVTCPVTTLAPGASTDCAASYTITQGDVDAGAVDNTAVATGTGPNGALVPSDEDRTSTPLDAVTALTLDKSVAGTEDVDASGGLNAADTVSYRFLVTNAGTTTVTGVGIDDDLTGGANCPQTTLAPGASTTCTFTYTVTQVDVDAGQVDNTATATGTGPDGPTASDPDGTTTPTDSVAALELDKVAARVVDVDEDGLIDAGDTIDYAFVITNTGTLTLSDVGVDDPMTGPVSCPRSILAPDQQVTCLVPYTVTQADVDTGQVDNTATATGAAPSGTTVSDTDTTTTPTGSEAALELDKIDASVSDVDEDGLIDAGDTIDYAFVLTNTGTLTLSDLAVQDPKAGTVTCPETTTVPGQQVVCSATYTITQADVDNGSVDNTAAATATSPDGPTTSNTDTTATPTDFVSSLALTKSVASTTDSDGNGLLDAGDAIDYEFLIENTGTVTVEFIGVDDAKVGAVDCPRTSLAPGQSTTCAKTYTVTQSDADAGEVRNTAVASGSDPNGDDVESNESSTDTPADQLARLTIAKSVTGTADLDGDDLLATGDTIDYAFVVTNTGTVTITRLVVEDPVVGAVDCPTAALAPAATTTCTATYAVTQDDTDAASIVNRARALGEDPDGGPVQTPRDTVVTPLDVVAELRLTKGAGDPQDANESGRTDAGDTVDYTFVVTNTGTVTMTSVAVADPLISAISCEEETLAVDTSTTCSGTYVLSQDDLDAGTVLNTAHAEGTAPDDVEVTSPDDSAEVLLPATPALELAKSASLVDADGDGRADAGEVVDYTFVVTNTGSVTIGAIAIDDLRLETAGVEVTCPADASVPPDATVTCRATYRVSAADAADGEPLVNTASAIGVDPDGASVPSNRDDATVQTDAPAPAPAPDDPGSGGDSDDGDDGDDGVGDEGAGAGGGPLPDTGSPQVTLALLLGMILLLAGAITVAATPRR